MRGPFRLLLDRLSEIASMIEKAAANGEKMDELEALAREYAEALHTLKLSVTVGESSPIITREAHGTEERREGATGVHPQFGQPEQHECRGCGDGSPDSGDHTCS